MTTPTGIIYDAYLRTTRPIMSPASATSDPKPMRLLEPEGMKGFDPNYDGLCYICGETAHGAVPTKTLLSDTFTDGSRAKAPESRHICRACAFCMGTSPEGRAGIRWYPLVAGRDMRFLERGQVRDVLLNPPEPPFVILLPTSQKKHIAFKAQVAYRRGVFPVALEEEVVWLDAGFAPLLRFVEALRGAGFTTTEIGSIQFRSDRVKEFSIDFLDAAAERLREARKNRQFAVAMFAPGKMEGEEARCYLDLTLGTSITPPERN